MIDNMECPVDNITVNENRVRTVAFLVLLLGVVYLITGSWIIVLFLWIDFILRAYNLNTYSPLAIISGELVKWLKFKSKPVNRAPKRFAAFVGILFLTAILLTLLAGLTLTPKMLAGVLILFAALEAFAGFCAGCYVYSLLKRFKPVKNLF